MKNTARVTLQISRCGYLSLTREMLSINHFGILLQSDCPPLAVVPWLTESRAPL
jgi:hypothetical protein